MGEYADMMLEGDSCQYCGEYLGGGDGYPRSCRSCRRAEEADRVKEKAERAADRAAKMRPCPAPGCKREIPDKLFACGGHWKALPDPLRRRISGAYYAGIRRKEHPTTHYLEAAREAFQIFRGKGAQGGETWPT